MVASSYKDLSLWGRQNREVRVYATPSYPIYSVFAQLEMQFKDKTPKNVTPIALDARRVSSPSGKPRIVVLVVGERSEERRVGKEWVSTGKSRWSPEH